MVRTKDDMLSKRIERLLHAYHFSHDYTVIERNLYSLLRYIDHANEVGKNTEPVIEDSFLYVR